jgi:hypothetical protein
MKILFISRGMTHDYLSDMLFHGLRTLLGADVVDVPYLEHMDKGTLHGGYTVWGLLDPIKVDRFDIPQKIHDHYFDAVIYGDVQLCQQFINDVMAFYHPKNIAFCDGRDDDNTIIEGLIGRGQYFKREKSSFPETIPIQFGIPEEKIRPVPLTDDKTTVMAPLIPGDFSTYIYDTEEKYYQMYANSFFAKTWRKGGWDCCRHYEIMAAGCLPYFVNLEDCPPKVMELLPRKELFEARNLCDRWNGTFHDKADWISLMSYVQQYLRNNLTTTALAKRVLERTL